MDEFQVKNVVGASHEYEVIIEISEIVLVDKVEMNAFVTLLLAEGLDRDLECIAELGEDLCR